MEPRRRVHLVLQGEGWRGQELRLSDPRPVLSNEVGTGALPGYRSGECDVRAYRLLEAEHLKVLKRARSMRSNSTCFVEKVCHGDGVFIVDTGATTFVPLWNYILENEILDSSEPTGEACLFIRS